MIAKKPRPTLRLVEDEFPSRCSLDVDWGPWIVWALAIGFVLALVTSTFDRPAPPDDGVPPRVISEEMWEADPSFWYEGQVSEEVKKDLQRLRP